MTVKILFTKRARRYFSALIATGVTTLIGLNTLNKAHAQGCGLHQATEWQLALTDPQTEQTPEHILAVTEAFLRACPQRPEFQEASRVAGIAAADLGEVETAAAHFRKAGAMRDLQANFYAIAAFVLADDHRAAWQLRDRVVERWRTRLERHPDVALSAEPTAHGMIYQLYFTRTDDESGLRAAWVAVPFVDGWPATLSFSRDGFRFGLRQIRASAEAEEIRYVDMHRCQGRRTLGEISVKLSSTDFDDMARAALTAYLANPDQPSPHQGGPLKVCIWPGRLLPSPPQTRR